LLLGSAAVAGGGQAATSVVPARSVTAPLPVQRLALSGRSVAYVADAPDKLQCARIGLWRPQRGRQVLFASKEQCLEQASTGQGVWDVAVATNRVLWITYAGGNQRDWTLWTASVTKRTPRQLRSADRDVDAPGPIVIGPGTSEGIPYAVGREIVYLGDDGRAIFTTTVSSAVRAIAAGPGGRLRVAALLASGEVVGLDTAGQEYTAERFPSHAVTAIRVSGLGIAVQVGDEVEITPPRTHDGVTVALPPDARLLDVAQGHVLYSSAGDIRVKAIATGAATRVADGTSSRPALGQLEPHGLAWARGRTVSWSAALPR
jgi:hypothetical protein